MASAISPGGVESVIIYSELTAPRALIAVLNAVIRPLFVVYM